MSLERKTDQGTLWGCRSVRASATCGWGGAAAHQACLAAIVTICLISCSTDRRLLAPFSGAEVVSPEKPSVWLRTPDPICSPLTELKTSQDFWRAWTEGGEYYVDRNRCMSLPHLDGERTSVPQEPRDTGEIHVE